MTQRRWMYLALVLIGAQGLLAATTPVPVSPGGANAVVSVESRCPTFSWSAVEGAEGYELVVYRIGEDDEESSPVLSRHFKGSVSSWTPSLDSRLERGGRYAWAVRTVGISDTSPWSEARLFQVAGGPTSEEVSEAIEVIIRYAEAKKDEAIEPRVRELLPDTDAALAARVPVDHAGIVAPTEAQASVAGSGAIWAEAVAVTGESHGVIGITHSSGGVAVAAENAGGGPDVLLKGDLTSPDLRLTEATLDRPSDTDQTFEFMNSLAGSLTLKVDGVDVITTATDQDTLNSLACDPTQVAQWNGSAWVCADTGGTDTLASLSCSQDEIARWTGSIWECSSDLDSLGTLACTQDQIAQWNGSAWICTDPAAGGSDTLGSLSCAKDQIVNWNGSAWVCGQPSVTHHTCSNSGLQADCTVNCPGGSFSWTGGCSVGAIDYLTISGPTGGASGPTGWRCQAQDLFGSTASVTADLYCIAQ